MFIRIIILLILLILITNSFSITNKYDKYFKRYSVIYFPGLHWQWFKAQSVAESSLNPTAKSYVGALGLMQVMPKTAEWLGFKYADMVIPELAIHAGIKYDYLLKKMWKRWSNKKLKYNEILYFIFASYNAGQGNILKAYKMSGKVNSWYHVSKCLPKVTGKHSKETITYIKRIRKWYIVLLELN